MASPNFLKRILFRASLLFLLPTAKALKQQLTRNKLQIKKSATLSAAVNDEDRGTFLSRLSLLGSISVVSSITNADTGESQDSQMRRSPRPYIYKIDYTIPPTMLPFSNQRETLVEKDLIKQQVVFLSYHRKDNAKDFELIAKIIDRLFKRKKDIIIGFEGVQQKFQSKLDLFIDSADGLPEDRLEENLRNTAFSNSTEMVSFESYLPILRYARQKKIELVALGLNDESVIKVAEAGLEGLSAEERNQYVIDFKGFIDDVKLQGFIDYSKEVLLSIYEQLNDQDSKLSFQSFFALRVLSDEAVASKAVETVTDKSGSTLIVLQNIDHIKYGYGSSGRVSRIAENLGGMLNVKSVILNPTAADSLAETTYLRLSLGYGRDQSNGRSFADYVWYSDRPYVNQLTHLMNEVDDGPIWNRIRVAY